MKHLLLAGLLLAGVTPVLAQTAPPATQPATPPQTTAPGARGNDPAAPIPGANSFTEVQATERLREQGLMVQGNLQKGDDGIWRGRATRNGAQVNVAVDYRGNVTATN